MYYSRCRNVKLKSYSIFFILALVTSLFIILFSYFTSRKKGLQYANFEDMYIQGLKLDRVFRSEEIRGKHIHQKGRPPYKEVKSSTHIQENLEVNSTNGKTILENINANDMDKRFTSTQERIILKTINVVEKSKSVSIPTISNVQTNHTDRIKVYSWEATNRTVSKKAHSQRKNERDSYARMRTTQTSVINEIKRDTNRRLPSVGNTGHFIKGQLLPRERGNRHQLKSFMGPWQLSQRKIFQNLRSKMRTTSYQVKVNSFLPIRNESCINCFNNNLKILMQPKSLCKNKQTIDLLILISSTPHDFDARNAVRDTWGSNCNHKNSSVKCVFVLGRLVNLRNVSDVSKVPSTLSPSEIQNLNFRLKNESSNFKDIVQLDFSDTYSNLTTKTLSGILWGITRCPKAKYIMKTDTDMYVNTFLLPYLVKQAPNTQFIGGYCWGTSSPIRDPKSKWYVSFNNYIKKTFPPLCSGTGYVMSKDLAASVVAVSKNIPFFHLEDVYVALCLRKLQVYPINLLGFSNMHSEFEPCYYKNQVITSHYTSPDQLRKYWGPIVKCQLYGHLQTLYDPLPYPDVSH